MKEKIDVPFALVENILLVFPYSKNSICFLFLVYNKI
jgi:hypothetical protein